MAAFLHGTHIVIVIIMIWTWIIVSCASNLIHKLHVSTLIHIIKIMVHVPASPIKINKTYSISLIGVMYM